jgi:hypothetical protein
MTAVATRAGKCCRRLWDAWRMTLATIADADACARTHGSFNGRWRRQSVDAARSTACVCVCAACVCVCVCVCV